MSFAPYRRKLSTEEINELPIMRYEGEVRLVRAASELQSALAELEREDILGFDTETRPNFHKGKANLPSLVQLATRERVFLIQLELLPLGAELAAIFANKAVIKVGVGIRDDMRELRKLHSFNPEGLVDLGDLARALKLPTQGLRNMAANLLGWRITKGSRCSNWSLHKLSARQVNYAATDAWIGRELYRKLLATGPLPL